MTSYLQVLESQKRSWTAQLPSVFTRSTLNRWENWGGSTTWRGLGARAREWPFGSTLTLRQERILRFQPDGGRTSSACHSDRPVMCAAEQPNSTGCAWWACTSTSGRRFVTLDPIQRAAAAVAVLARELEDDGITLEHLDLGGGLGISYDGADIAKVSAYADVLIDAVAPTRLPLVVEPGRWIVGPAGVLVASVVDVKRQETGRYFVVVDAGMSEFLRPALYGAFHRVEPLEARAGQPVTCDVVGPICETSDVVAAARTMPLPEVGDLVAVLDAGAYGSAMASNYNRHPLPAEVMIEDRTWRVIRRRQSFDDLVALET